MEKEVIAINRYNIFKQDFKKDTGLDYNAQNLERYIQYYNARVNDQNSQVCFNMMVRIENKISEGINFLRHKG
jgi:hypothetical protein